MDERYKWHRYLAVIPCIVASACTGLGPVTIEETPAVRERLQKPKVCVALSGGGLRSAAFSTGVLRNLRNEGSLEKIDLVSATSGGGWALLWLHARLAEGLSLDEIYGTTAAADTEAIRKLENRSFIGPIWKLWTAIWGPARAAWAAYYAVIAGKFGSPFMKNTSLEDINKNVVAHRVPVPIITASTYSPCGVDETQIERYGQSGPPLSDRLKEMMPMDKHLIELTPLSWGSTTFGYSATFPFEIRDMEDWAQISAAAIDAPVYRRCAALRAFGFAFGAFVVTPRTVKARISDQEKIYLADGGVVDNLASRNLIERGCKTLLISDAEHDPAFLFEAYQRLKQDLSKQGQQLVVKEIDDWLVQRGADICPRQGPCFQADNPSNGLVKNAAFDGCVTKGGTCKPADGLISRIIYLKLSIDPLASGAKRLNTHVSKFYKQSAGARECKDARGLDENCSFPQTPTFKTDFTAEEFRAYRLLGEDLMGTNGVARRLVEGQ